jgi:hypothetical protein
MSSRKDLEITLTNHETFLAIAHQHNEQVKKLIVERDSRKVKDDRDVDFHAAKNAEIQRTAMVSVIFSALALEAFINNYGIERFSGSYFDNYLDKLSAVSKWIVIPRLVTGKEIDRDGQAFEWLKGLFMQRDKLVHYKTRKKKISELREDKDWVTEEHSEHALQTVRAVVEALSEIDPNVEIEWLKSAPTDPYA